MVDNNMVMICVSGLVRETAFQRMVVCNSYLEFCEENMYNLVRYCENLVKNTSETVKRIWGYWLPPIMFFS